MTIEIDDGELTLDVRLLSELLDIPIENVAPLMGNLAITSVGEKELIFTLAIFV
jgi:hypothetical protein